MMLFEKLGLASGSELNRDKSFVVFLGPWRPDEEPTVCGIRVVKAAQKIFGLFFDNKAIPF